MSDKTSLPGEGKLIGKIIHYFGKVGVAVVKLSSSLKIGDDIRVVGGEKDFEQIVESMELNSEKIEKAKSGEAVGLKINQKVKRGYNVYKL